MIDEIKKTFKKRVKEHEWIDEKTTKYVFEKANMLFHALQIKSSFFLTIRKYSSYGFRESNIVAVWGVFHYSIANDIDAGYFTCPELDKLCVQYSGVVWNIFVHIFLEHMTKIFINWNIAVHGFISIY